MRSVWSTAAAALVVAATLAACGSDQPGQAGPTPAPTPASAPKLAVEVTWATPPFGRTAITSTLTGAGLGAHAARFFEIDETPNDLVITVRIVDGQWTAYRAAGSPVQKVNDRGTYAADGTTLLYRPDTGGSNTYRWSVTGNELTLTFVSTTEPDFEGVPNDVFQRAFYTTVAFHRV